MNELDYFGASIPRTYLTRSVQTGCTPVFSIDGTDESCQDPFRIRRVCETPRVVTPGQGAVVFELYALSAMLDLPADATRIQLLDAMKDIIVGKAAYVGRFRQ